MVVLGQARRPRRELEVVVVAGVRRTWIGAVLAVVAAGAFAVAAVPAASAMARSPGGTITTVAGGVGGPGPARSVAVSACGVEVADRSLYIGSFNSVRRVSTSTGWLTTVAGNNGVGGGNGDPAVKVPVAGACGTAVDAAGNVLIASGLQVQVVAASTGVFYGQPMTAGDIYMIAGQPPNDRSDGPSGDGGPAIKARLFNATGVAVDQAGNVVIADSGEPQGCGDCEPVPALVRIIAESNGTFYGQKMTAGDIYSVASAGTAMGAVRLDRAGNVLIPDGAFPSLNGPLIAAPSLQLFAVRTGRFYGQKMTAGHIYQLAGTSQQASGGDGGLARKASLESCGGVAVDRAGNLVIADDNRVRVIAVRSGRFYGQQMTAGHIYGIAGLGTDGYSGDGGPAVRARVSAGAVAVDGSGNVVLGVGDRVRVIAARSGRFYGQPMTVGHIYTVAGNGTFYSGSGQPAARAEFFGVGGVAEDRSGDLAFGMSNSDTDIAAVVWVVMGRSGRFFGRAMTAGDSYPVAVGGPGAQVAVNSVGGTSVAFDHSGNLLVADPSGNLIRVIAVRAGRFYGRAMTAGHAYIVAGTLTAGFSGDGGLATRARLNSPGGVAVDQRGNVLVADSGNGRVRVVVARAGRFYGEPMAAGHIYTIAGGGAGLGDGGPAIKARVAPGAVATDPAGNVVIAGRGRIRVVAVKAGTFYGQQMTAGDIYTVAGNGGEFGFSGNGGPALDAEFGSTGDVAVDASGNIAMADGYDQVVWVVAAATGTFYGQAMTAGDIYVVAGNGTSLGTDGLGDGGPATQARLGGPAGVAITPSGDLLVVDSNRIRSISR